MSSFLSVAINNETMLFHSGSVIISEVRRNEAQTIDDQKERRGEEKRRKQGKKEKEKRGGFHLFCPCKRCGQYSRSAISPTLHAVAEKMGENHTRYLTRERIITSRPSAPMDFTKFLPGMTF